MTEAAVVQVTGTSSVRFDVSDPDEVQRMLSYLDEHGYAVVANVATVADLVKGKNEFWSFWEKEKYRGELRRDDVSTWNNWMANAATGILVSARGANHNDFLWGARTLPRVHDVFSKIWSDDNLIVSFDAGGVFRPWKHNIRWLTNGGWWHTDQNSTKGPHRQGRVTVQGLVTYFDATAETGGLCVIPGSHKHHEEVCQRAHTAGMKIDYVSVEHTDPIFKLAEPVLVCAKAGDLILWDSRTIHCNTPALHMAKYNEDPLSFKQTQNSDASGGDSTELLRLVAYVCMVPRSHASMEIMERRKQTFVHKMPTSHYPTYEISLLPREKALPWTKSADILKLVGYSSEEISRIQAGLDPQASAEDHLILQLVQLATVLGVLYILFS